MRDIGILTTSRADFGIYLPILRRMARSPKLRARLIVSGSHLDPRFGRTVREIRREQLPIFRQVPCMAGDVATSMSRMLAGMGRLFRSWKPDLLLVLGDRYEMLAGALAAVPAQLPLAHIHGGEISLGAMDDSFRHALSKCAHLHFAATQEAARRLERMGEAPWRITVSGAPALDRLAEHRDEDLDLPDGFLLVTYHAVTREPGREAAQAEALAKALARSGRPCVVTAPNADPGGRVIRERLLRFCRSTPRCRFVENAGGRGYFTMLSRAAAMVGNSSSGLIEAPSFRLPTVNVGTRQEGRLRARNVIDCGNGAGDILQAIRRAISPGFRRSLGGLRNPYGDGRASERIVRRLETVPLDDRLLRKEFFA